MPIEFYCSDCNSLLRTPDDAVGKGARCPNCGEIEVVPSQSVTAQPSFGEPFDGRKELPSQHSAQPIGAEPKYQASDYSKPSADVFSGQQPYASPNYAGSENLRFDEARSRLMLPAIFLLVFSILGLVVYGLGVLGAVLEIADGRAGRPGDVVSFLIIFGGFLMESFAIVGAVLMLRMKRYGVCVAAAIVGIISNLCCLIPIPFAIWALVLLMDARIKANFS